MRISPLIAVLVMAALPLSPGRAQDPATIDFARDIQPLFQTHCVDCHGAEEQKNGFRLDRRRDAMRGGTGSMIGRGNSTASRLYLKLVGNEYGPRMPPEAPLSAAQIKLIKDWIDQGAHWPDELSGELPTVPPDPSATRLMVALRASDRATFQKLLMDNPGLPHE